MLLSTADSRCAMSFSLSRSLRRVVFPPEMKFTVADLPHVCLLGCSHAFRMGFDSRSIFARPRS